MKGWMVVGLSAMAAVGCVVPAWSQPKIEFDTRSVDFGTAYPNEQLHHDFIFWNKGNQTLEITKVSKTCGCTAPVLSATSVLPSASAIVSVTMRTSAPVKKSERVILDTNDPENPQVQLALEADVKTLWNFTPKTSFLFNSVPFDSEQTMEIYMKSIDNAPFKILATKVNFPELTVKTGESTADGIPIQVTVKSGKEKKIINDQLMIETDNPKQKVVNMSVFARIVGVIEFSRNRVFFGSVNSGESKSIEVTASLPNPAGAPDLQFTQISSDSEAVTAQVTGKTPEGKLRVQLNFTAPQQPGYISGNITFKTNNPAEPETTLPFSALVRGARS
ncbi:MAG: DUF1573 domain-containing protein [bacterium]